VGGRAEDLYFQGLALVYVCAYDRQIVPSPPQN